jgi:uncharacterized membrane protein YgcG
MKTKKISFSKDGIKDFFFRHVEKIFFGLACLLILLFFWIGFRTPAFEETSPKELLAKSENADRFINDESHWNQLQEYRSADTEVVQRIKQAKSIDPDTYAFRHIFGTAVYTLEPRRDPALVPPREFEVQHIRAQVAQVVENTGNSSLAVGGVSSLPDSEVLTFPPDQRMESFTYRTDQLPNNIKLRTVDAVVGMALIDHAQQLKNYRENFEFQRGYDPLRDVPEYAFIEVQRKTDDGEWEPVTKHVYEVTPKYLASPAKELGDEDYILPTLALPIPPFLGMDYRQFSLLDKIPTRDVFSEDARGGSRSGGEGRSGGNRGSGNRGRDPRGGGNQLGGNPPGGNQNPPGGDDDDLPWGDDPGSDDEGEPGTDDADEDGEEEVVPLRLVRFYDLERKEPGKKYYYRLRVWVKDPNNPEAVNADIAAELDDENKKGGQLGLGGGMGGGSQADSGGSSGGGREGGGKGREMARKKKPLMETDLSREVRQRLKGDELQVPDDLDDARKELYRLAKPTEWVEATQPITIRSGFETFVAGPVDAPPTMQFGGGSYAASEPSINIVANSFQEDLGVFVPAETEAMVASVLNFEAVTHVLDPLSWAIKEVFESVDSRGQKEGREFETDAIILDIMGGQRQPFSRGRDVYYAPGECLIMDRNGRIHVRSDIEDETAYRHATFASDANKLALEEASGRKRDDDDDEDEDSRGGRGRRGRGGGGDGR